MELTHTLLLEQFSVACRAKIRARISAHMHQKLLLMLFTPCQWQAQSRQFLLTIVVASMKQVVSSHYHLLIVTGLSFVCCMALEEQFQDRETMLHLDCDTITAIIDGVTKKVQKGPTQKGDESSTSVAVLSNEAGTEIKH